MGRLFKHYLEQPADKNAKRSKAISKNNSASNSASVEFMRRLTNASEKAKAEARKTIYACKYCSSHFAHASQICSRSFQGKTGIAYLFNEAVNVFHGPKTEQKMLTGRNLVSDIYCNTCAHVIGWTYIESLDQDQKYKEGKFVIEKAFLTKLTDDKPLESIKSDLLAESSLACFGTHPNLRELPLTNLLGLQNQELLNPFEFRRSNTFPIRQPLSMSDEQSDEDLSSPY